MFYNFQEFYYFQLRNWINDPSIFDVRKDGFQTLRIPTTSTYEIEIVAPGNCHLKRPGVRIKGTFALVAGDKITAALGQQGSHEWGFCGSGGSFLTLETKNSLKPLLIAGGAGSARFDEEFERGNIGQNSIGNNTIGSSGQQKYLPGDENLDEALYCAGAGFNEGPVIHGTLAPNCSAPMCFSDGLTGGIGRNSTGQVQEGGFGGGGGYYHRRVGNR